MKTSTGYPRKKSHRWRDFDYVTDATYFITICAADHGEPFGHAEGETVRLNEIGRIVEEEWLRTPEVRPGVILDRYQVMPDHFHGILFVPSAPDELQRVPPKSKLSRRPRSLGSLVGGFKGAVTNRVRELRRDPTLKVWQENYDDRCIRNTKDLEARRKYIDENPMRWAYEHASQSPGEQREIGVSADVVGRGPLNG